MRNNKPTLFVPTTMSVAMAAAGVIPGTHLTKMMANTAVVRHRNDNRNQRPSVTISL